MSEDRPVFKRPVPRTVEYRFYYDARTGVGVLKNTGEDVPNLSYIVLDESSYRSVEFCSKYKVVNGVLVGKTVRQTAKKLEKNTNGQFRTIKNNMLFLTNSKNSECWDYLNDH
jgi:dTDP-glucose pyrophosphorylase